MWRRRSGEGGEASIHSKNRVQNEVICLSCGKVGFKTLSRHFKTIHQMKPGAGLKEAIRNSGEPKSLGQKLLRGKKEDGYGAGACG
ncbi:MAG: hypothetical protein A2075_22725 [Geobacteraceae bacterium GWC2_58_44]|nr:MAG: hypothetical protein A2075_22725 [Geobacteraceae bacterium GWC2_58_44]HBG04159.1 hypothetical protein [Geobacter sp.]